jgi:putative ATP-binding cassette transporter
VNREVTLATPDTHPCRHDIDRHFLRQLWRLTRSYWVSSDRWIGRALLAGTVALELGAVYGNVLLSQVQRRLFDALQEKSTASFVEALAIFFAGALVFVLVSVYRIYLRQILEIRWRRWLTDHYLENWIGSQAYYRMELHEKHTDNPDQRIAEDVRSYVASALGLSLSLLSAVATIASFAAILWTLSGSWLIHLFGRDFRIPGFMMWVAIGYAALASWLSHRVGRRLAPINFDQQRYEADFRYGLVRFRESVEAVAFYRGEQEERERAQGRFHRVVDNWRRLIRAQRNLSLFTTGASQANGIVPLLLAAPGFFLGRLTLGDVVQTNIAYSNVSSALTWFMFAYQEIADWRASLERLFAFGDAIEDARCEIEGGGGIRSELRAEPGIRLVDLRVALPDGRALIEGVSGEILPGQRVMITGPSGSGKSTLFRAIAGIWPYGGGRLELSEKGRRLFLPQRPYVPIGTLRAAACYPSSEGAFPDARIAEALAALGLGKLVERLGEDAHWEQQLSGGEQQRLALARALLQEPDWLFLDEATAALDEAMEERAYELIEERLPEAAVISIAHRAGVAQFHDFLWTVETRSGRPATLAIAAGGRDPLPSRL